MKIVTHSTSLHVHDQADLELPWASLSLDGSSSVKQSPSQGLTRPSFDQRRSNRPSTHNGLFIVKLTMAPTPNKKERNTCFKAKLKIPKLTQILVGMWIMAYAPMSTTKL